MNNYNSNGYNQHQFRNAHINNKMVNEYDRMRSTNVPFSTNQMLMNNPQYCANVRNSDYYARLMFEKMEQMKKIKSVEEIGISKDQLTNYIICPIKIEKEDKQEFEKKYNDKSLHYVGFTNRKSAPEFVKELWKNRTNNPYKNILKDENYKKNFKKKKDLVVHHATALDKNLIKTMKDYEDKAELIELLNGELRIKYSKSKENKYKEKFDYINKVKYRIKYDPKNYNELKQFYKQETKKIKKTGKMYHEMLEMLLASENFTKEEMSEINKPFEMEAEDDLSMTFEKGDSKLEKRLEKEIEEELGLTNGDLDEILKECLKEEEENKKTKSKKITKSIKVENPNAKIIIKNTIKKVSSSDKVENKSEKKPLIVVKPIKPKIKEKVVDKINLSVNQPLSEKNEKPKVIKVTKAPKIIEQVTETFVSETAKSKKIINIIPRKDKVEKKEEKVESSIGKVTDDDFAKYKNKQKKAKE
jgi:hypothetical protein